LSDDSLTYFKFQVSSGGETWYINCGIPDFVELHEQLLKNFPRLTQSFDIIKKKFSSKHFEKLREEQLEMYFQSIVSDAELIAHPIVKTFLRIFDTSTPVLSLTILRADHLSDKEKGALRGYCEVFLSDREGREALGKTDYTRIIENSSHAKWRNEQFKFLLVPEAHNINIIFWEKAGYQGFSFVRKRGSISIPLSTIPKNKSTSHWFPIEDISGKGKTTCGEIKLELKLQVPKDWDGPVGDENKHVSHYHDINSQNAEAFKEQQVLRREIREITEKLQRITDLKVKLKYRAPKGQWPGCLFVTLIDASEISYREVGPINPFIVLTLLGESKKTQPKFNAPAPSFHQVFQFIVPHTVPFSALRLHLALWQKSDLTRQALLASAHIPLVDHLLNQHKSLTISIGLCAPAPIEMLTTQQKGLQMKAMGYKPKLPILAIPGLVASALAVEEGKKDWTGERVWISLEKLGKHKVKLLTLGSRDSFRELEKNVSERVSPVVKRISSLFDSDKTKSEEVKAEEVDVKPKPDPFLEQQWIQHMSLAEDGFSDPPGIRVRPVKGREGVSFLADDSIPNFIRKHTYVMGPTMSNLAAIGYTDDNLVAFPYDWRLPLPNLETRDQVFTELRATIERMVKKNNSKIVILAHSMGNRTIHYFLNMVAAEEGGRQWIDDHIHSLFAVAAPWLGAPKMARGMISGERMGLDMFLRSHQAIEIVKTHGGFPSLLPIGLKHWFDDRAKRFMYFDMGTPITEEEYDSSDSDSETEEKEMSFKKNFILNLFKRGKTQQPAENNEQSAKVSFVNVTEFNQDDTKKSSRKRRVKRSNSAKDSNENTVMKKRRRSASGYDSEKEIKSPITSDNEVNPLSSPDNSAPSSPRGSRRKISRSGSYGEKHGALSDGDELDDAVVNQSERKSSRAKRPRKTSTSTSGSYAGLSSNNNNTNVTNQNNNANNAENSEGSGNSSEPLDLARVKTLQFKTELKKTRGTSDASKRPLALSNNNVNLSNVNVEEVADNDDKHFHHTEEPILIINKPGTNKPISQYQGVSIKKALLTAGFERQYNHLEERRKDKYYGGYGDVPSAILEPPPVDKIFAVYGVNVDTEKVYFYRKDTQKNRYVLDKRINGVLDEYPGYVFIKGVGWETEDTPQKVIEQRTGFIGTRTGDGTVPYESLSYCHNWRGKVKDLSIIELPKAEHRAIVCTANFFEILVDYVCEKTTNEKEK
jgi:hypothetical protein